jgi:heme oxygenase
MTMMNRIREAISAEHNAIERTPYSLALISSQIDKQDYLFSMAQMHSIHATLENACDMQTQVALYFTPAMRRTSTIERDLRFFGAQLSDYSTLAATESINAMLTRWSQYEPLSLIGAIYILEGSRMGSLMLAKPIAAALGVSAIDGHGIDYHVEGARETPMRLKAWKEAVSNAGFAPDVEAAIQACACEFMSLLCRLYEALPTKTAATRAA